MSTDDEFEATLRRRLADLAGSADADRDWVHPLPAARERAAAGVAPDDDPAIVAPTPLRPARQRWLPGLAVAAVLLAVVTGAGLGIRALAGSAGSSGSASSAEGAAVDGDAGVVPRGEATTTPTGTGISCPSGPGADCAPPPSCGKTALTSTGPLAATAAIRPAGVLGPRTTPGGTAAVPYQLTFAENGGTAQVRPAEVVQVGAAQCGGGTAAPGVVQVVTVAPGAGQSGSASFTAVGVDGRPLSPGDYQVVVVISYSTDGSELDQLVSPPVTVTVGTS